eukprot:4564506-Karenia_brevis.AAC.1
MKVVSKRRRRFEKDNKESRIGLRSMDEKRHECGGCGAGCQNEKWIQLVGVDEGPQRMILDFQVADVSKPLLAVKRVVEKSNMVVFGPGEEDNFILNRKTGDK